MCYRLSQEERVASAVEIPGQETDEIAEMAKKYSTYISMSIHEKDPKYPEYFLNTAFIMDPMGRIILKYRKLNPWIPLEVSTSPHDLLEIYQDKIFPVVETELGNLACMVCYDQFFPEVARQLTINGAEVHIKPTSFCSPWHIPPMEFFALFNRTRSIENMAYGVYPNVTGNDTGYLGGDSMIVDYNGRVLTRAPAGVPAVIGATINIDQLREARKATLQNSPRHLRTEAYPYLQKSIYKPNKLLS